MASLVNQTPVLSEVRQDKQLRADDQIRAECHLRTHYPAAYIKYLYQIGSDYSFRVNEYAPDLSRIINSDFVVVTVTSERVQHMIRTVR